MKHARLSGIGLLFLSLLLSGCDSSLEPDSSIEVAVKGLYSSALSSDGRHAITGSINHGGALWKIDSAERLFDWNHREEGFTRVTAAAFSPEGRFAMTADYQEIVLWNTVSGEPLTFFAAPGEILSLDLTPEGDYAILGLADHTAVLFNAKRGGIVRTFFHDGRVRSVSLSADGRLLATGSEDYKARLWAVESGELLHSWQHDAEVRLVELSALGDRVLSVSKYDRAALWNAESGAEVGTIPLFKTAVARGLTFTSAAFSHDSKQLLTGTSDRRVQLWNTTTLDESASWTLPKRDPWKPTGAAVLAVAFSTDGGYVASASNGFIQRLSH